MSPVTAAMCCSATPIPWFATYQTVPVRKALGDQVQAMLSGRVKPADAVAAGQRAANALLLPYAEQTALTLP